MSTYNKLGTSTAMHLHVLRALRAFVLQMQERWDNAPEQIRRTFVNLNTPDVAAFGDYDAIEWFDIEANELACWTDPMNDFARAYLRAHVLADPAAALRYAALGREVYERIFYSAAQARAAIEAEDEIDDEDEDGEYDEEPTPSYAPPPEQKAAFRGVAMCFLGEPSENDGYMRYWTVDSRSNVKRCTDTDDNRCSTWVSEWKGEQGERSHFEGPRKTWNRGSRRGSPNPYTPQADLYETEGLPEWTHAGVILDFRQGLVQMHVEFNPDATPALRDLYAACLDGQPDGDKAVLFGLLVWCITGNTIPQRLQQGVRDHQGHVIRWTSHETSEKIKKKAPRFAEEDGEDGEYDEEDDEGYVRPAPRRPLFVANVSMEDDE